MFGLRLFFKSDKYPFCDVFCMTADRSGKKVVLKYSGARKTYPKEQYKLKDVADPEVKRFGDFWIRIPRNAEDYLSRYYGPQWSKVAVTQDYCHQTKSSIDPVSYAMEDNMYKPAMPFN